MTIDKIKEGDALARKPNWKGKGRWPGVVVGFEIHPSTKEMLVLLKGKSGEVRSFHPAWLIRDNS